jgi:tRNA-Thr(GGU) m(6)t(6)A37 methyltransferase TsaA
MRVKRSQAATTLRPIGVIRSTLTSRKNAPRQGFDDAPDAWLEVRAWAAKGLYRIQPGDQIIVLTWLHRAARDVLQVHPPAVPGRPLMGVFATRSPDRPNPIGLHPVVVRTVDGRRLRIGPIEAIDGTPVIDIKPVLSEPRSRSRRHTR